MSHQREPAQRCQQTHLSLPYRQAAKKRREQGIFRDSKISVHVFVLLIDLLHMNSIQFLCVSLDKDEEEKSLPPPVDTRIITFCVWGQHIPKLILLLKPADSLHVLCCVFRRQHSRVKNRTSRKNLDTRHNLYVPGDEWGPCAQLCTGRSDIYPCILVSRYQ